MEQTKANEAVEVLIVEDSPTQAEQLRYLLGEAGYQVRAARNGLEALRELRTKAPTLVISDVVMPVMDGYTLCKTIKASEDLKKIPVVLVTSLTSPADVIKGLESGADNFIRKPYESRELLSKIAYTLTNKEARKESKMQAGLQIALGGQKYFITAERQQILDLLIATYDDAVNLNQDLVAKQWELAQSNEVLRGLYRIAKSLNVCITVQEVLDASMNFILELPGVRAAWVILMDSSAVTHLAASRNLPPGLEEELMRTGDCQCWRNLMAGQLDGAVATFECERIKQAGILEIGSTHHVSIPLRSRKRPLGIFNLLGPEADKIRGEDLELWGAVGDQVATALERAQLLEGLELKVAERTTELEAEYGERRKAEDALRQSEVRYRRLADSNMVGVMHKHQDGRILEANEAFLRMVGYDRQDLADGKLRWDEMTAPEYLNAIRQFYAKLKEERWGNAVEKECIRKDGSRVPLLIGAVAMGEPADEFMCVALDMSSRRLLEEQLRQSSKMEAIGRLAGGVAHDFNNLLTIINGYAQLLLDQVTEGSSSQEQLQQIVAAGTRAATLTRQLLAFARRQVFAPQSLDLNGVVTGFEKMIHRLIGEDIELVCRLKEPLASVTADPGQIEQVVMNLVVNSRDAMPHGGKLTLETAEVELDENYCRTHVGAVPGRYVLLAVSDTGVGMDKETQAHIFEPFFTTKEKGKGTGLGLATVHGIVKQSGGHLGVYSEAGKGTTFKIYLPRGEGGGFAAEIGKEAKKASGGVETILLVEDETGVMNLATEILRKRGYQVLATASPENALHISAAHKGDIDLLVTDVVMPQMSGRQMAERLAPQRPRMKVLYMSGYTDNAIVHHGILDPGTAFIQKPFTPESLVGKVREVLDEAA